MGTHHNKQFVEKENRYLKNSDMKNYITKIFTNKNSQHKNCIELWRDGTQKTSPFFFTIREPKGDPGYTFGAYLTTSDIVEAITIINYMKICRKEYKKYKVINKSDLNIPSKS